MDLNEIYTEILLENTRNKQNKREIEGIKKDGINPSCGDELKIILKIDKETNIIKDASFQGKGCAISEASANIMCEMLKNMELEEAKEKIKLFLDMILMKETEDDKLMQLEDAYAFKNISYMPARVKCATLAWNTAKIIIEEFDKKDKLQ